MGGSGDRVGLNFNPCDRVRIAKTFAEGGGVEILKAGRCAPNQHNFVFKNPTLVQFRHPSFRIQDFPEGNMLKGLIRAVEEELGPRLGFSGGNLGGLEGGGGKGGQLFEVGGVGVQGRVKEQVQEEIPRF